MILIYKNKIINLIAYFLKYFKRKTYSQNHNKNMTIKKEET